MQLTIKEAKDLINEEIALRDPNESKIAEYAEKMDSGVKFPPIEVGHWPKSEKYGEQGIVDGLNRLAAAAESKQSHIEVVHKQFKTLEEMLTYMYTVNMAHGIQVTEGQRNKRIKLLKQVDPKLTLEKISKQFGLSTASIDRILKGGQGEGKSGPKGANKSKGQKSQSPKKSAGVYKMIEGLNVEFSRKRPNQLAELGAYLSPATEENPEGEIDQDKVAEIKVLINYLSMVVKELT